MKTKTISCLSICVIICFQLCGCTSKKGNENTLIQFDVSASYPEKEIKLEDVADVEYLQLEFDEDFLFTELPSIITEDKIIIKRRRDGDILIFSRAGKPLSKFNRRGNGPGDYADIDALVYDEIADELFVISGNRIKVYSPSGDFKRTIPLLEGASIREIEDYDSGTLLLYDNNNVYPASFSLISKKDGSVVGTVDMPQDKKINTFISRVSGNNVITIRGEDAYHILRYKDGFLLTDFSIDTVYFFSRNKALSPVLVRKPAIQSMDPVIYLNSFVEAGNYEFFTAVTVNNESNILPTRDLMRDKQTGSIFSPKITFNDGYRGDGIVLSPKIITATHDSKLGLIVHGLLSLQKANSENKLSGKLKELVENSDEDGNSIYMLLHFK